MTEMVPVIFLVPDSGSISYVSKVTFPVLSGATSSLPENWYEISSKEIASGWNVKANSVLFLILKFAWYVTVSHHSYSVLSIPAYSMVTYSSS